MSILDKIVADTRDLVARRKAEVSLGSLEMQPLYNKSRLDFAGALRNSENSDQSLAIIAEIKKASPSKGVIREDFDLVRIASQYTAAGANALSVLTEPLHFQGDIKYLASVREVTALPLLRKDFIIDPYQLVEARAHGADAVLLIATILDKKQLHDLHQAAGDLNLDCLVEIYHANEMERIDFNQVQILGVNNRNLHTFEVDLGHSTRVFASAPENVIKVSESGIYTSDDLRYLQENGSHAVLIGESFMRADNPGQKLMELREG